MDLVSYWFAIGDKTLSDRRLLKGHKRVRQTSRASETEQVRRASWALSLRAHQESTGLRTDILKGKTAQGPSILSPLATVIATLLGYTSWGTPKDM